MKSYNVILLYNEICNKILMCERRKPPYQGLRNLVGGKVEPNEDSLDAAYRE
jgi:8-oxo-dGTP diphosphatase